MIASIKHKGLKRLYENGDRSKLLVFAASRFPESPVAEIHMPRRVPNGLHGNWFPA